MLSGVKEGRGALFPNELEQILLIFLKHDIDSGLFDL